MHADLPEAPLSNRGWTPAMVARLEPPVLELEEDYEERLAFPAGDRRVVLALGGIPIEVRTNSGGSEAWLRQAFAEFVVEREPAVRVEVTEVASGFPFRTLVGTLMTYARGPHVIGKFREMAGFIDTRARRGRGVILGENYRQDLSNYLRLVVDSVTPPLGAVLFHTAAVAERGRAFLFYGSSTAGKSTLSRLSATRRTILTDDMLILRLEEGRVRAATCGFWGGETKEYPSRRLDLPVAGFFRLRKGSENALREIAPGDGALDLVCGVPSMKRSVEDQGFILRFAAEAAASTPFRELTFHKRDDSFWRLLETAEAA